MWEAGRWGLGEGDVDRVCLDYGRERMEKRVTGERPRFGARGQEKKGGWQGEHREGKGSGRETVSHDGECGGGVQG